jgi:hypothetical protein
MSTYAQAAKRLVLVATALAVTRSVAVPGELAFKIAGGPDATAPTGQRGILELLTGDKEYQATNDLNLVSEIIEPGMVKLAKAKAYAAPYEAMEVVTIPAAYTFTTGEEVVLTIGFDAYGSVSMKNYYNRYGAYVVPNNSTTAAQVAGELAANLSLNVKKDRTRRVDVAQGGDPVAVTASVTQGSTAVVLVGATPGVYGCTIDGVAYILTVTSATAGTLSVPYAGVTNAAAPIVAGVAEEIYIVGEPQVDIDFNNMIYHIGWRSTLTLDGSGFGSKEYAAGSTGSGWGEEVAQIELFANGSTARWQWNVFQLFYKRRVNAVKAESYDTVNIELRTTKEGRGSDVTSIREIQCYFVTGGTDAADLVTALQPYL